MQHSIIRIHSNIHARANEIRKKLRLSWNDFIELSGGLLEKQAEQGRLSIAVRENGQKTVEETA